MAGADDDARPAGDDGGLPPATASTASAGGGEAESNGGEADSEGGEAGSDRGEAGSEGGGDGSEGGEAGPNGGEAASDRGEAASDGGEGDAGAAAGVRLSRTGPAETATSGAGPCAVTRGMAGAVASVEDGAGGDAGTPWPPPAASDGALAYGRAPACAAPLDCAGSLTGGTTSIGKLRAGVSPAEASMPGSPALSAPGLVLPSTAGAPVPSMPGLLGSVSSKLGAPWGVPSTGVPPIVVRAGRSTIRPDRRASRLRAILGAAARGAGVRSGRASSTAGGPISFAGGALSWIGGGAPSPDAGAAAGAGGAPSPKSQSAANLLMPGGRGTGAWVAAVPAAGAGGVPAGATSRRGVSAA
jgi:hypothetical protein